MWEIHEGYTMIDYKIIKFCRICKKRYIVKKGENKKIYCDECQKRIDEEGYV